MSLVPTRLRVTLTALLVTFSFAIGSIQGQPPEKPYLYAKARALPKHLTNQGSGYFAIIEGKNGKLYIGTALYGKNAFLVEFDPVTEDMRVVVDCMKEIGSDATGFAAQAKIHTRNNIGPSGKIYFGTKQGYPETQKGEKFTDYPGGYPMVYDPETETTRVYPIPVPHQGIISMTPDESRGTAYVSTCSDERPESSHFLKLDLKTGEYRDFGETNHMYAFIVVDYLGRAYHPMLGGDILRYDPKTDRVDRLKQTIDGKPPTPESNLAHPQSHCINWEIDANRKTLYAVAMSGNQMYSYDLTATGDTLPGKSLGKLIANAESTDCRAMSISPYGVVWAAVRAKYDAKRRLPHLVSYKPGDAAPTDNGPIAVRNTDFTTFTDRKGEPLLWHQGFPRFGDGNMVPNTGLLGVCATRTGQYVLALSPFTLLEMHARPRVAATPLERKPIAGITTVYHYNSHSEMLLGRMLQTETLDGQGRVPTLKLASLYLEQKSPRDTSRTIMSQMGVPIVAKVADALTLGGDKIAVEGVAVVAEHGDYPKSPTGAVAYPKRKLFEQIFATVDQYGRRGLPAFCDKHLADTWTDAKWIYDEAKKRDMPLMAGSSLPLGWRSPPIDVPRGAKLKEIHALSYAPIDVFGIHALEAMQALAERRAGGETGVAAVQTIVGSDVWAAADRGVYDRKLFDTALSALRAHPIPPGKRVEELAKKPILNVIEYRDGLKACLFTLDGAVEEWTAAWRDDQNRYTKVTFAVQEERPYSHFAIQLNGIEQMVYTGKAPWPVERTLLTSGLIDDFLQSQRDGGTRRETPHLDVVYHSDWNWTQPINPAPVRPYGSQ